MYLTYDEYKEMGGGADETSFSHLEKKASSMIDDACWDIKGKYSRVAKLVEEGQLDFDQEKLLGELVYVLCGMVDKSDYAFNGGKVVTSTSNDGVSVTYGTANAQEEFENIVEDTMANYLRSFYYNNVPVLYRGID